MGEAGHRQWHFLPPPSCPHYRGPRLGPTAIAGFLLLADGQGLPSARWIDAGRSLVGRGAPAPPSHPAVGCLIRHAANHLSSPLLRWLRLGQLGPPVKWGEGFCWVGRLCPLPPDSPPLLLFESGTLARAYYSLSRSTSFLRFITSLANLATALHLFLHPNICRTRLGSERSRPTFSIRTRRCPSQTVHSWRV